MAQVYLKISTLYAVTISPEVFNQEKRERVVVVGDFLSQEKVEGQFPFTKSP